MPESIETGLILMVTGMVTVFLLLGALVWIVRFVSWLARRIEPKAATPAPTPPTDVLPRPSPAGEELATVIGAAVKAHRDRHSGRQ